MEQILLHLLGDFILQNDFMATNKKNITWKGELACQIHCITYSLPFLLIGSWQAVVVIYVSHYIIDRSKFISWFLALRNGTKDISNFGFGKDRPFALSIWLNIITDNTFHLACNYFALKYLAA